MNPLEETYVTPIRKDHPIFNSLVAKIMLSLGIVFYSFLNQSAYSRQFLYEGDQVLFYMSAFFMFIGLLTILALMEALVMTGFSVFRWVFVKLRRIIRKG